MVAGLPVVLTQRSPGDHNHPNVTPSLVRVVVNLIVAPYVALSIVPLEHVHGADPEHPRSAAHRHTQAHTVALHDDDHAQLADDDSDIVWLDTVPLRQAGYQFPALALPLTPEFVFGPSPTSWAVPPDYDTAPPHGPPRACLSLRAPPCLSA